MCWTTTIAALLTPLIAIATAIIAYQQWKTNRRIQETNEKRLKHERYDKRFAVYDSVRTFLRNIMIHEKDVSDTMVIDYWSGINPSRFLLNEEIATYLEQIEHVITKFRETDEVPGSKGIRTWAEEQVPILNGKFYPYLHLAD
jgi:hypothetical protein